MGTGIVLRIEAHNTHYTTLSSHLWNLKDRNENFEVKWSIIDRAKEFNPTQGVGYSLI
jgi:hypothetical protein